MRASKQLNLLPSHPAPMKAIPLGLIRSSGSHSDSADEDDANEAKKADHSKPPTGKKVTRDPKAPKQPSNDVIKFPLEEIRSTVVAENPEMKPLDVTAEAEKRWRELREKQKQP